MNTQFSPLQQRPTLRLLLKCKACGKSFAEELAYCGKQSATCPYCGWTKNGGK